MGGNPFFINTFVYQSAVHSFLRTWAGIEVVGEYFMLINPVMNNNLFSTEMGMPERGGNINNQGRFVETASCFQIDNTLKQCKRVGEKPRIRGTHGNSLTAYTGLTHFKGKDGQILATKPLKGLLPQLGKGKI